MKISELADAGDVSVATVKYYLREGVLPPGRAISRTQADYDDSHVERLRLVRALIGVGGLSLARVRQVLSVIEDGSIGPADVMSAAQLSLYDTEDADTEGADGGDGDEDRSGAGGEGAAGPVSADAEDATAPPSPGAALIRTLGWHVRLPDPVVDELDEAIEACVTADIGYSDALLARYAQICLEVAETDLATVPSEPAAAVRQVVLGTVLLDPVLVALRRLAQQHAAHTRLPSAQRGSGFAARPPGEA